jgi:hypothetical protein
MKNKIIFLIIVISSISCSKQTVVPFPPDSFLKEVYVVRSFLKRSLSSLPKGVSLKTPADGVNALDVNWPGKALISDVEENKPWKSHAHYHFVLDLGNTELVSYSQSDSYTMTASILLDYYFSSLEKNNFKPAGEVQTFLLYPVQFASNTWFREDCNITVTASIYVNIEYKNAFIAVDTSEIYQ